MDTQTYSVLTPVALSNATAVGARKFRKMVLPRRKIFANKQDIDLGETFRDIERAELEKAFDSIPLQVADDHTPNPKYTEGLVSNFKHEPNGPDGDGLYADITFADERSADMVRKNPLVGVSCSLVKNLARKEDGQWHTWPAAVQHVLMTTDPHVRGMGTWREVNLSRGMTGNVTVFDLSNTTYSEGDSVMTAPTTNPFSPGGAAPADVKPEDAPKAGDAPQAITLTPEEYTVFKAIAEDHKLAAQAAAEEAANSSAVVGGEKEQPGGTGPVTDPAAPANLSRDSESQTEAINLMREELAIERQQRIDMQREAYAARVSGEIERYERDGLAPSVVSLAREILEADPSATVINLGRQADGTDKSLDCADVVRRMISEVLSLARQGLTVIDLDRENGHHVGSDSEQAARKAKLEAWDHMFPGQ